MIGRRIFWILVVAFAGALAAIVLVPYAQDTAPWLVGPNNIFDLVQPVLARLFDAPGAPRAAAPAADDTVFALWAIMAFLCVLALVIYAKATMERIARRHARRRRRARLTREIEERLAAEAARV